MPPVRYINEWKGELTMTIGTGIAIAGVWIFAGLVSHSKTTTGIGMWLGIIIASVVTVVLST